MAVPELPAVAGGEEIGFPPEGVRVATQENPAMVVLVTVSELPSRTVVGSGAMETLMPARVMTLTACAAEEEVTAGLIGSLQVTDSEAAPGRTSGGSASVSVAAPVAPAIAG